jgi:hypothetical protein
MTPTIPIIIVAFRNPRDIILCLQSLSRLTPPPAFSIHICENGGGPAFDALVGALTAPLGPCRPDPTGASEPPPRMRRVRHLRFTRETAASVPILIGEARENLGYAGGVNAWLEALQDADWPGVWVLNPDTQPEPSALAELVLEAERSGAGLIGSRQVSPRLPGIAAASGLRWRKWRAATASIASEDVDLVRRMVDAPSGASIYATRACIDDIGVMEERYFLYFEDLEWGLRAKAKSGISYAERSVVIHNFGTTIGSASSRRQVSRLSVFLDFRNRLLFVRNNYPGWLWWTVLIGLAEVAMFVRVRAWNNAMAALSGLAAGIRNQSGRPDHMLRKHQPPQRPSSRPLEGPLKRHVKLAISLVYFLFAETLRAAARMLRMTPRARLNILCYHGVRADQLADFTWQIQALRRWAHIVPADWQGGPTARPDRPFVALTFDDAFASLHAHALPLLKSLGLPCTIFVPTAYLGGTPQWRMETSADRDEQIMTAAQISQISGPLVTIGSHSVTHPHFTALPQAAVVQELQESRSALESLAGQPVRQFAFPYGDHNAGLIELCRDCGYTQAFTIEPVPVRAGDATGVRGRTVVVPEDGPLSFYLKAHGAYAWMAAVGAVKRAVLKRMRPVVKPWYLEAAQEP